MELATSGGAYTVSQAAAHMGEQRGYLLREFRTVKGKPTVESIQGNGSGEGMHVFEELHSLMRLYI